MEMARHVELIRFVENMPSGYVGSDCFLAHYACDRYVIVSALDKEF